MKKIGIDKAKKAGTKALTVAKKVGSKVKGVAGKVKSKIKATEIKRSKKAGTKALTVAKKVGSKVKGVAGKVKSKIKAPKPKKPKIPKAKIPKPKKPKIPKAKIPKPKKPKIPKAKIPKPKKPKVPKTNGQMALPILVNSRARKNNKQQGIEKKLSSKTPLNQPSRPRTSKMPKTPSIRGANLRFQYRYNAAVKKNRSTLRPRKLTPGIVKAINGLMEKGGEWGGGIDFESDTHLPERLHMKRGRIYVNPKYPSKLGGILSDSENIKYELRFHTHPFSQFWQVNNKMPSPGDMCGVGLHTPNLLVTRDRKLRPVYVLMTSEHEIHKNLAFFNTLYKMARYPDNPRRLRKLLNEDGYDFKRINPKKQRIFVRYDKTEMRRIEEIKRRISTPVEEYP